MVASCLLVIFLLGVNLFNQVSIQAKNVTDILDEHNENVMQALKRDSENINGLKNESDYEQKCDCGFGSKGCHYNVYDEKNCDCMADYAQNNDKCERCYCGLNVRACTLRNNKKVCTCLENDSRNDYYEKCAECDCGFWSLGCHYNVHGEKICNCMAGYAQKNDKCERCYCGIHATSCVFKDNKKVCTCLEKYLLNDYYETCVECNCGYDAISCHLDGMSKVCTCKEGYIIEDGKCTRCDCGPNSISCELTSDKYTRCTCVSGYIAERRTWKVDEYCKLPGVSVWRIATYIESVIFALIILVCTIIICRKIYLKND